MPQISYNEALGRRDADKLSDQEGKVIEIAGIEFEDKTDKDGKPFQVAYISTADKTTYRSSNKVVLSKCEAISKNLPKGSTVKMLVSWVKPAKGNRYLDLLPVDEQKEL